MKKTTLLILAATLTITSSALAHPCRGYRRPCRRPVVVEHHHHHRSHSWHSEDWGKLAAGVAVGWLVNEAFDSPAPREVVYAPPAYRSPVFTAEPVYRPPVVAPAPSCQTTIIRQPVVQTIAPAPSTTIVTHCPTPVVAPQPIVTVIQPETIIRTDRSTTIVRQISY